MYHNHSKIINICIIVLFPIFAACEVPLVPPPVISEPQPVITVFFNEEEIPHDGTIDMGETVITKSKTAKIAIKNTGNEVLHIDTDAIRLANDEGLFSLLSLPVPVVSVNAETQFTIEFTPRDASEKAGVLTIPCNAPSHSEYRIYVKASGKMEYPTVQLEHPETVILPGTGVFNFGTVTVSTSKTETFTIRNTGVFDLVLTGDPVISLSDSAAFSVSAPPLSKRIVPGGTMTFAVTYTPETGQSHASEVTIMINGMTSALNFTITGQGYEKRPRIVITQDDIPIPNNGVVDFGTLPVTKEKTLTFITGNTGEMNLIFSNSENRVVITDNPENHFSLTRQPGTNSFAAGQTETFNITFKPKTAGNITAYVLIETNSPESPFTFQIRGTATEASKESRLKNFSFSKGTLVPAFNANITDYTLQIDAGVPVLTVTPEAMHENYARMIVNGRDQESGAVSEDIVLMSNQEITIVLYAEHEDFDSIYTIHTQRIQDFSSTVLNNLTLTCTDETEAIDGLALLAGGNHGLYTLPPDAGAVKFKVGLKNGGGAKITVNGLSIANNIWAGPYQVTPGQTARFSFKITAQDGKTEKTFTIDCVSPLSPPEEPESPEEPEAPVPEVSVPGTPAGLTATGRTQFRPVTGYYSTTSYTIIVSWAEVPGATNYKVYYATSARGPYTGKVLTESTSARISVSSSSTDQYIKVSAVNSAGESPLSAYQQVTSWTSSGQSTYR
jgi:archaellum component FlaG (FlaF/FlaG flagellin family)